MVELLIDGKNAFLRIIECIRRAEKSIYINMFIWRNDTIGNLIAEEVLIAANRGVHVYISKDRYGIICECCEETRNSFFHRKPNLTEKISIEALRFMYSKGGVEPFKAKTDDGKLLESIFSHPNITIETIENKYDHSKFYIFDDKIIIFGGINIEDKENSLDYFGHRYRDYMIICDESQLVDEFFRSRKECKNTVHFGINIKKPVIYVGMRKAYLDMISSSKEYLTIMMAYFSPLPDFEKAIIAATERNVKVRILIPRKANFQDNLNRYTVHRLWRKSGKKIEIYFYPQMLHAKLLINENEISIGSCNITKKAFNQLDELNFFLKNDSSVCAEQIRRSVQDSLMEADRMNEKITYSYIAARLESLIV